MPSSRAISVLATARRRDHVLAQQRAGMGGAAVRGCAWPVRHACSSVVLLEVDRVRRRRRSNSKVMHHGPLTCTDVARRLEAPAGRGSRNPAMSMSSRRSGSVQAVQPAQDPVVHPRVDLRPAGLPRGHGAACSGTSGSCWVRRGMRTRPMSMGTPPRRAMIRARPACGKRHLRAPGVGLDLRPPGPTLEAKQHGDGVMVIGDEKLQGHAHRRGMARAALTPEQYHIMREHGTERPGSCALLHEKRPGTFAAPAATRRCSRAR